ncbi:MAG: redoxin domain-containing protein [Bryobacterales bacterium]|nr:redoxin domain-containing protein [Bryobacterales bacterium]
MRLLLLLSAAVLCAQNVPTDPGVKVGEPMPAFSLPNQNGEAQTLETLRGPKGLMLVFFRSADW